MPAILKIMDSGHFADSEFLAWFDTFQNYIADKSSIVHSHLQVNMDILLLITILISECFNNLIKPGIHLILCYGVKRIVLKIDYVSVNLY